MSLVALFLVIVPVLATTQKVEAAWGNLGVYNMPSKMRGTWVSRDKKSVYNKIRITKNTITLTHKHKAKGTLSANDISPQENVALITVYAANKYRGAWQSTLQNAEHSSLNVSLIKRDDSSNYRGQGYIYEVNAGKDLQTRYTLQGNGSSQKIFLYQGERYLGIATVEQIVRFLNKINCDAEISRLQKKVTIDGSSSSNASDADESKSDDTKTNKSDIPGDAGIFTVPASYRGVWYSSDSKVELTAHSMVADGEKTELHHQSANFSEKQRQNRDIQNKTMHIAAANMTNINGFSGIYTAGWCQNAGEKTVYALHQEKGQPVLLEIGTAGGLHDVMWRSPQLARKYAHTKFADLRKLGGIVAE
jgi:hypothetical protein